jgi:hypothetical protein
VVHHGGSASAPIAQEVRRATARYQDVTAATAARYALFLGCVSGPQGGAMGIHYVNGDLVGDGKLDAARPEALMYEPGAASWNWWASSTSSSRRPGARPTRRRPR